MTNFPLQYIHVFYTYSFLGVIHKNPSLFNPPLPSKRQKSMDKLVFGVVNKIFLAYDKPFLNPEISEVGGFILFFFQYGFETDQFPLD